MSAPQMGGFMPLKPRLEDVCGVFVSDLPLAGFLFTGNLSPPGLSQGELLCIKALYMLLPGLLIMTALM